MYPTTQNPSTTHNPSSTKHSKYKKIKYIEKNLQKNKIYRKNLQKIKISLDKDKNK